MASRESDTTFRLARPPRAIAWVLLLASAAAVLLVGLAATGLVLGPVGTWPTPPATFWIRLAGAALLTIASLGIRTLRWVFLLRRAETRIPIRDAYIGYLAGFSLLFAPLLLGEIAVRAIVMHRRGRVPVLTTAVVNVWERVIDLVALACVAAITGIMMGRSDGLTLACGAFSLPTLVPALRRQALRLMSAVLAPLVRLVDPSRPANMGQLASHHAWLACLAASVLAWVLPGVGLWLIAGSWDAGPRLIEAEFSYATSTALSGVMLAPAGVIVTGREMLGRLTAEGGAAGLAALVVLGVRLATVGVSFALGAVFALIHVRTTTADSETHFDDIADAYDVQIPEGRRLALLERKTALMKEIIESRGVGRRGLDVGCGQGAYVRRMRDLGFEVSGIDPSGGQIERAERNVGERGLVRMGSVLEIPASDSSFDFVYVINVLHHLKSESEQRRAFAELFRVIVPGGLLFVHEINTRNVLFRFYMSYVFPSLNCIDEGVEYWLLPHRMQRYTPVPVAETRYFTFLPDFIPQVVARWLQPLETLLEQSAFRAYSGHYMSVFVKQPGAAA
jgi:ubiquinone/menaquinone biosynthesis C-methylase UbiE